MADDNVSRLPPATDTPASRLISSREDITRRWLLEALDGASLEEIERLETDRVARELPDLVGDIARALTEDGPAASGLAGPGAGRLSGFRGGAEARPAEVVRDVAALERAMLAALRPGLEEGDTRAFAEAIERLVEVFAAIQAAALDDALGARLRELEHQAHTDELTGLYNVRYLRRHIDHLARVHERYGHPFAVTMLDVDDLKRVNDRFGHAAGDRLLAAVAQAVRATVRAVDTPVRMGGDEFCVLAPHETAAEAEIAAGRLDAAVRTVVAPDGLPVGVSIGVAACPEHGCDAGALLEAADAAMYRAKRTPRVVGLAAGAG